MAIALGMMSLAKLYREVREALQQAPSEATSADAIDGFALEFEAVKVGVAHLVRVQPGCAWLVAHLGPLPSPLEAGQLAALMDANFMLMAGCRGARFGRDAATGELLLQHQYSIAGATAHHLLARIACLAGVARMNPVNEAR